MQSLKLRRQEKMKKKNKHCVYEWLPCPSIDIWLCFLAFYNHGPILRFPLSLIPFSLSRFPSLTASHMRSWLHWSLEINKKNKHGKHTHKEMLLMGVFSMFVIWYDHDMICCWVFHWCVLHQVINLCIFARVSARVHDWSFMASVSRLVGCWICLLSGRRLKHVT